MKKIILALSLLVSLTFATTVAFHGAEVTLNNNGLKVGDIAPEFTAVKNDLKETIVGGKKYKIQIIAFIPSLNTGTCALQALAFNKKVAKLSNVHFTIVSKDLPFAQLKFCKDNNIRNLQTVSDYKNANNAKKYGATITSPASLEGFFARVVYIVDTQGRIAYVQKVNEITLEPNYHEIYEALKKTR